MQPHRQQPTRLRHHWDSPGKNTGVGCHFLLQYMKVKSESEVAQSAVRSKSRSIFTQGIAPSPESLVWITKLHPSTYLPLPHRHAGLSATRSLCSLSPLPPSSTQGLCWSIYHIRLIEMSVCPSGLRGPECDLIQASRSPRCEGDGRCRVNFSDSLLLYIFFVRVLQQPRKGRVLHPHFAG